MSKAADLAALISSQSALSHRNMIINGAVQVAQRATSVTGIGGADGYFTADRWKVFTASLDGRVTQSQASVTDLAGFPNSLKHEVTTADTSISAGEAFQLSQVFEGQDLQSFKKGYSDAKEFTFSFYVKGTAKTYCVEMYDGDNTRHVAQTFSVTSSWNRVELTFPADTTGKFDDDNALSLYIIIWLHAGSNFTSGTFPATWASATNANRAVGAGSLFSATSNTFEITGAQLELGEQATPFEHRSFGDELRRCQRYFFKSYPTNRYAGFNTANDVREGACVTRNQDGSARSANAWPFHYPVTMRTQPTITSYSLNGTSGKVSRLDGNLDHSSDQNNNGYYETAHQNGWQIVEGSLDGLGFGGFHVYSDAEL